MNQTKIISELKKEPDEINLKDFAQFFHQISFNEALHRVRRMSWDSVLANEFFLDEQSPVASSPMKKVVNQ